ncbi:MAG: energy transducer TonB [Bacteroidia bacterium]
MKTKVLQIVITLCVVIATANAQDNKLNIEPSNSINDTGILVTETMPEFKGGEKAMMKFIADSLKYPIYSLGDRCITGKVYVTFMVMPDGSLTDIRVLRGIKGAPEYEKEAVRVIKKMPNWIPVKRNGKPVAVQFNLPLMFGVN